MKKIVVLSVLLVAVLGLMIVPVNAFVNPNPNTFPYIPTVNNNYELYGPHVAGINCIMYIDQGAEWTAMNAPSSYGTGSANLDLEDWALTTDWISAWTNNKAFTVQTYGGENGYFILDMNNNATLPDGTPNPMADFYIRAAIAYLTNRTNIVSLASGWYALGIPMYTICPPYMSNIIDTTITPTGGNSSYCCTYPGTNNSDPAEAAHILKADADLCYNGAEPGTLNGTWYDNYTGHWAVMPTMTFYVRNDDPERILIGDQIWGETQNIPGLPPLPITEIYGSAAEIENPVMYYKDFAMYTGAWTGIGPTPDVFFNLYAQEAYWPLGFSPNYDHCSFDNTYGGTYPWATNELALEYWLTQDFTALSQPAGIQAAKNAQWVFALCSAAVPLYCHAGYKAVSNTPSQANEQASGPWMQMVNLPSVGMNNWYTLLDAVDPTATNPSTLYINYGFKSPYTINMQNILYYSSYWDGVVLGEIYDSGATLDPVTLSTWVPQLFENWSVGTWTGPFGTCTYVNLTLRPDVYWQDGQPLTIADVIYTLTECGKDLIAKGLPPPWWWPVVSYFVSVEQIDAYNVQILLNVQSYWALAWVISSVIIPKHIWQPLISGYPTTNPTISFADPNEIGSGPFRFHSYDPLVNVVLDANTPGSVESAFPPIISPGYYQYYPLRVDISLGPSNLARIGLSGATRASVPSEAQYYANINLYNLCTSGSLAVNMYVYVINDTSMANVGADLATNPTTTTPPNIIVQSMSITLPPPNPSSGTYDIVPSYTVYVPFYLTVPNAAVIFVACYIVSDTGITTTAGEAYEGQWVRVVQPLWATFSGDIGGSNLYADLNQLYYYLGHVFTYSTIMANEIPTPDLKVDGRDITIAAKAFGTVPGDSRWNPVCDVNHDYKIDGRDITIIAKQFGWH
jgi:hypothetical protein